MDKVNNNMNVENNTYNDIKKFNVDLIPIENKLILDLHGLNIDEVRLLIDQELLIIEKNVKNIIKVIILLHGYSKGEILKRYIREEYKHKLIKRKEFQNNPGITYFIIEGKNE